jgi:hypothetical protein
MDGDGIRDPQNVFDAAGAAMVFLCADNRDLSTAHGLRAAVLSYNDSVGYLRRVLGWKAAYDREAPEPATSMVMNTSSATPFTVQPPASHESAHLQATTQGSPSSKATGPSGAGAQSGTPPKPPHSAPPLAPQPTSSSPAPSSVPGPPDPAPSEPTPAAPDATPTGTDEPIPLTPVPAPSECADPIAIPSASPSPEPEPDIPCTSPAEANVSAAPTCLVPCAAEAD